MAAEILQENIALQPSAEKSQKTEEVMPTRPVGKVKVKEAWGGLHPRYPGVRSLRLTEDEYTFGRDSDCDYDFNDLGTATGPVRDTLERISRTFSNLHFKLTKTETETGVFATLLDQSANGTFVNGIKLGKGNQVLLKHGDIIALSMAKYQAWGYREPSTNLCFPIPERISASYFLSQELSRDSSCTIWLCTSKANTCKKYPLRISASVRNRKHDAVTEKDESEPERKKRRT